jgi:anti-anti-sigma factor
MTLNQDNASGLLKILGTLDIDAASALRQMLLDAMSRQPAIAVDLSEVEACDTAALQVLLAGRKERALRITGASAAVIETAAALGLSFDAAAEGNQDAI